MREASAASLIDIVNSGINVARLCRAMLNKEMKFLHVDNRFKLLFKDKTAFFCHRCAFKDSR